MAMPKIITRKEVHTYANALITQYTEKCDSLAGVDENNEAHDHLPPISRDDRELRC